MRPEPKPSLRPRDGRTRLWSTRWRQRRYRWPVVVLAAGLVVAGCGSGPSAASRTSGQPITRLAAGGDVLNLKAVCPATVAVLSSWFPQVEHAALYELLGSGYTVDAGRKRVAGPLVADTVDTGVRLEIRAGGPAVGNVQTSAEMYLDKSITLGMLNTDELIQQSAAHAVLGVVAPLELDPQVLAWDPAAHPEWNSISDIGQTDAKVLYYTGSPFMNYLTGTGILRPGQVDDSYKGFPDTFVAASGRGPTAVQGYATNEPYAWAHEVPAWGKKLAYQLVNETGYPNYANVLGIRAGDKAALAPCLAKLVPIIQAAQVRFMAHPDPVIKLIVDTNTAYKGFPYDKPLADYAVKTMRDLGIVGNGRNRTLGDFDRARIGQLINILDPIARGQKKPLKAGLSIDDVFTNEYIDAGVGLPTQ